MTEESENKIYRLEYQVVKYSKYEPSDELMRYMADLEDTSSFPVYRVSLNRQDGDCSPYPFSYGAANTVRDKYGMLRSNLYIEATGHMAHKIQVIEHFDLNCFNSKYLGFIRNYHESLYQYLKRKGDPVVHIFD